MKKNLIKKVFAVSLSIAMACSFLPAANPVTASAAAPYVSLKTTFKTLKVNQSYKMTLKNNTINWKIKKVETTDKTIATVYGKTTSQVMIKGKSEGRATVRVRLATSKRKTKNTKTLRCRVKVVPAATDPTTPVQTDATVTNQADLDTALKNSSITKITIKPTAATNFVIAQGSYPSVDLIVDAPQSDIENSATFKSITINNIKSDTWTEKGTGNTFSILAKAARLIVDKAATVRNITIGTTDASVNLVVNGGTVQGVNVNAKAALNITGTAAENAALIPVIFGVAAADSVFTTELPVAVTMSASVELVFEKGAVKSTVKLQVAGIKATITNKTSENIVVTKNDNTTQNVAAGANKSTVNATGSTTPVTPGTPGGSTGGSTTSKPLPTQRVATGSGVTVSVSGTTTGEALTVSYSSITVTVANVKLVSPAAVDVECTITAKATNWTKTLGTIDLAGTTKDDKGNFVSYAGSANGLSINGAPYGEPVTLVLSFRVKETASTAPSPSVQGEIVIGTLTAGDGKGQTFETGETLTLN